MIKKMFPNNLVTHARKGKILSKIEEFDLISKWREKQDQKALK